MEEEEEEGDQAVFRRTEAIREDGEGAGSASAGYTRQNDRQGRTKNNRVTTVSDKTDRAGVSVDDHRKQTSKMR